MTTATSAALSTAEPAPRVAASEEEVLVIVIGMLKGGTAKTHSAMFIALRYALQGKRVIVLDGDPTSQSAWDWVKLAVQERDFEVPYEVERYPFQEDVASHIRDLRGEFDVVIVDAGGGNPSYLEEVVAEADIFIAPFAPTEGEARRLTPTFKLVERAAGRNARGLVSYAVMVKADHRTGQPKRWRQQVVADGHPLADTDIDMLVLYSDAYGTVPPHAGEYEDLMAEIETDLEAAA